MPPLTNKIGSMKTLTHIALTSVVVHQPIMRKSLQADLDLVGIANHYGIV
jgi:hypothetical protein